MCMHDDVYGCCMVLQSTVTNVEKEGSCQLLEVELFTTSVRSHGYPSLESVSTFITLLQLIMIVPDSGSHSLNVFVESAMRMHPCRVCFVPSWCPTSSCCLVSARIVKQHPSFVPTSSFPIGMPYFQLLFGVSPTSETASHGPMAVC